MNGGAAHDADQQCSEHDAPEAAEPSDYDHYEGDGDDFGTHRRCTMVMGAKRAPAIAAIATPNVKERVS